jgi:Fe-S-cluster-containing dehydrogenase component
MTRRKAYELAETPGPALWRSLEEKDADAAELRNEAEAEHPGGFIQSLVNPASLVSRRAFVQGSSISALAAGLQGCIRRPEDIILPYVKAPEHVIPGIPSKFATVTARGRDSLGVVVTSHDGRPTKAEGNSLHSASRGATDTFAQEYVWDLYDPDRSQKPARRQANALIDATDADFDKQIEALVARHAADKGAGLRFLAPICNSPSFRRMRAQVLKKFPEATFHVYSPINDDNAREGARIAFGQPSLPIADYDNARVVLSLGADFLGQEPDSVRAARGFGETRRPDSPQDEMSRLYVVESNYTVTGSIADHRLRLPQSQIEAYARALTAALGKRGVAGLANLGKSASLDAVTQPWLDAVAADLAANRGRALVVAGSAQPARVHALVHALNQALGNVGKTVFYGPAHDAEVGTSRDGIRELARNISSTQTLFILGGNPVYDAPADLDFRSLLATKSLTSVHLSDKRDETSELCSWHAPLAHELEAWGDQESRSGVTAIQQPLIAPLYGARSAIELLAVIAGEKTTQGHDIVQQTLRELVPPTVSFDTFWRRALHAGVAVQARVSVQEADLAAIAQALDAAPANKPVGPDNIELSFEPDPGLYDGRHANNLWALELPRPMTKIVWDNAAIMSPATRDALGLRDQQMVRLKKGERSIEVPVWALPGHADHSITLSLGWGRTAAGRYGNGKGFDVYPIRTSDEMDLVQGVTVEPLARSYNLVQTQSHDRMEGRPIAIDATVEEYRKDPEFASYRAVDPVSVPPLWQQQDYGEGHQWGMSIDLSSCTGCNACVVACQAENNIPSVGKREVERGREMSWLRIDRYFVGDDREDPQVAMQPVACQQCEEAPCENVCPVNATTHSPEGLNDMAYNRCVGTRYCANNCPYKVRRFNYLNWQGYLDDPYGTYPELPESRKLQFNPNVTVRMRGVMEKCTYCVQRIQEVKIGARNQGRDVGPNEIKTACQQACPSQSIVFGDLNNPKSNVAKLAKADRRYHLLAEIGTRPRTTFLGRIRNPNPAMAKG